MVMADPSEMEAERNRLMDAANAALAPMLRDPALPGTWDFVEGKRNEIWGRAVLLARDWYLEDAKC